MTDTLSTATIDRADFGRGWEAWHREHEARRADPHGFLAITGLHWLTPAPQLIPGVPGAWSTGPEGPVVALADDDVLTFDGEVLRGTHAFGEIPERGGLTVAYDGGVAEVAKRGGHDIVRPRRPDHPFLAAYDGTPVYAPHPQWRVPARFVEYATPRRTEVGAAVDGLTHVYESPGYVEFTLRGETRRLIAFEGYAPGELVVLFTDETSGRTTYAANRTVGVPAPDADGGTVIDFTRAVNLPCAYTDFATCPLPPAGNHLPIAVEAGEKTPLGRVHASA